MILLGKKCVVALALSLEAPSTRLLKSMTSGAQTGLLLAQLLLLFFFTKDRFRALWSFLHLADNERAPQRSAWDVDKLYKVRPTMDILTRSFKDNFSLSHNVSVDEAMVKGKGRNPIKQYMPAKPSKRESKLHCLGCSYYAYLWDFQINAGKKAGAT